MAGSGLQTVIVNNNLMESNVEESERTKAGRAILEKYIKLAPGAPITNDFYAITVEHLFGNVWSRDAMSMRDRSVVTIAVLIALGHQEELKTHINGALNIGIDVNLIKELGIHVAHYAGWPNGMMTVRLVDQVLAEREKAQAAAAGAK